DTRGERRAERRAVVLGEEIDQGLALEGLAATPGHALELLIPEGQASGAVDDVDDVGDRLDEPLELLVGRAETAAALTQRARQDRGEAAGDVQYDEVERGDHGGVRQLERRAQDPRLLQRDDRDVAARGRRGRHQAGATRERDARVDR